jgi:hypothetical protein
MVLTIVGNDNMLIKIKRVNKHTIVVKEDKDTIRKVYTEIKSNN